MRAQVPNCWTIPSWAIVQAIAERERRAMKETLFTLLVKGIGAALAAPVKAIVRMLGGK